MQQEKGNISIHGENILPIIKKWLYSDRDIFIRGWCPTLAMLSVNTKRLVSLGEAEQSQDEKVFRKDYCEQDKRTLEFHEITALA